MRLKNKIALITGAVRGIGLRTADLFEQEGANVIRTDINASKNIYKLNVADKEDWKNIFTKIKEWHGSLDILVNNAGITGLEEQNILCDPENETLSNWRKVHAVNLDGVFLGCKYMIPLMKKRGGSIINISSRSGMVGIPHAGSYASSKAAVRNHTKTVALYCAEKNYNIRCNSIHPAAILTEMWNPILAKNREETIAKISADIPLKRMGLPIDVANAILFLASDESSYITGSELTIDGGILAGSTVTINTTQEKDGTTRNK